MNHCFNAIKEKFNEHFFDLSAVWNMDGSGFSISEEQAMEVLIYLDQAKQ